MRNHTRFAFVGALLWGFGAHAQQVSCAASDLSCIERAFLSACRSDGSSLPGCSIWINNLERSRLGSSLNGKLVAALGYLELSERSENPTDAITFREHSANIYRTLIADDPGNLEARVGLLQFAQTVDHQIALLREIVAVDPGYVFGWESLARLVVVDESADRLLESARYLETAYDLLEPTNKKWRVAAEVVAAYRRAGAPERASPFVEQVRFDFGLEIKLARFGSMATLPADERRLLLRELCGESAIVTFGPASCRRAIASVVELGKAVPGAPSSVAAAEDAADTMILVARHAWRLENVFPEWRVTFLRWIDETLALGTESAPLHVTYARLTNDRQIRLVHMQVAARLAPSDGEVAFGLALAYSDLMRWDEASTELVRAKELLPAAEHERIEELRNQAAAEIEKESN